MSIGFSASSSFDKKTFDPEKIGGKQIFFPEFVIGDSFWTTGFSNMPGQGGQAAGGPLKYLLRQICFGIGNDGSQGGLISIALFHHINFGAECCCTE